MTPTDTLTPTPAASATANQATVTASITAANIRRGPSLAYNATGGLLLGTSTTVYGRNSDGTWIYVAIPGQSGKYGWMTALAQYVTVSVNVMDLPLAPYGPPVPAFIENCTNHTLLVAPGNISIPDRNNTNNKVQLYPDTYYVFDEYVKDLHNNNVQVLTVNLVEGEIADIVKNGNGNMYSCP